MSEDVGLVFGGYRSHHCCGADGLQQLCGYRQLLPCVLGSALLLRLGRGCVRGFFWGLVRVFTVAVAIFKSLTRTIAPARNSWRICCELGTVTQSTSHVAGIAGKSHLHGIVYFCPPPGTSSLPFWATSPYGNCSDLSEVKLMIEGWKVLASIGRWNFPSEYFFKNGRYFRLSFQVHLECEVVHHTAWLKRHRHRLGVPMVSCAHECGQDHLLQGNA